MDQEQQVFINNEIWTLVFGAAFQRAYIYSESASDARRNEFKIQLKDFIEDEILPFYKENSNIPDDVHIKHIIQISNHSSTRGGILNNNRLNFGISQKLLNLLLKYKWCLFDYPEPPHFPLDRRIQEKLMFPVITPWTRITDPEEYLNIINQVREMANGVSLARFELTHYGRRRDSRL